MNSPLTFVTGFIEIPSNADRRDPRLYLGVFFKFTASLPYPLVVFVEQKNEEVIRAALKYYFDQINWESEEETPSFDDYRQVRVREFEELETYQFYSDFKRSKPLEQLDRVCSPECATILLSKTYLVKEVIQDNPFETTHFGWIDFGIDHALHHHHTNLKEFVQTQGDRVRLSILNVKSAQLLQDRAQFYATNHYLLAGAQLTGSKEALLEFHDRVEQEMIEMLKVGRLGLEEQVWGAIFLASPSQYDYIYGDYDHLLANMTEIRGNYTRVAQILKHCRILSYHRLGVEIIERVIKALDQGYEPIRELLPEMLHDGYICAFYYRRELADYLADTLCLLYQHSACTRTHLKDPKLLRSNLRFTGRDLDSPKLSLSQVIKTTEAWTFSPFASFNEARRWIRLW